MSKKFEVRIVGMTEPTQEFMDSLALEEMTAEDLITYCARVSNPANQDNFDTGEKLLVYCIKKKHWSIFEMANVVIEVKYISRAIGRQVLRHRGFNFQEFSQRYAKPTDMEFLTSDCRLQDPKNRQNSIPCTDDQLRREWEVWQQRVKDTALEAYTWAVNNGIAKELARDVLPEGLTPSVMYMNGTVRQWIHYGLTRAWVTTGTQKEHMDLAQACWALLEKEFKFFKVIEHE